MKTLSATQLRSQIYTTLDEIETTGEPVWIKRKGKKYKIIPEDTLHDDNKDYPSIFDKLTPHPDAIIGDPDDLIDIKLDEWHEEKNL